MPKCSCGCGGTLTQQTIRKHLSGKSVPRAIQAAIKAFRTRGRDIRPPQLKPDKKLRSSRRFFPSSPRQSNSEDIDFYEPSIPDHDHAMDLDSINENEDDVGLQMEHIIHTTRDVWSGYRSDDDDNGSQGSEERGRGYNDMDNNNDNDDDGDDNEDMESESENGYGMAMVDELGEEFEREVVANGKLCIFILRVQP